MAEEAMDATEGQDVAAEQPTSLHDGLLEVSETLQQWSLEGPPRNPRASAGTLFAQIKRAAPAVAAMESETEESRKRASDLEERAEAFRQQAAENQRQAEELAVQLRNEVEGHCRRAAEALEALEAARAVEAELRGRLAAEEARGVKREAEIAQLRGQNMALCAQVREGMPPVTVMCRVRPMESYGSQDPSILKSALSIDLNEVSLEDNSSRPRKFRAGRVLDGGVTQEDVFSAVAPLVETVTTGGSACIFAYGATGSGKTFTLQGGEKYGAAPGLAHHALRRLLEGPGGGPVRISMVEVYCEQIRDLLAAAPADAGAQPASVQNPRRDTQGRLVLDCARCDVSSFAEAEELLLRGYAGRAAGGTLCNERSSRSHVVLFAASLRTGESAAATGGQLVLVDLAGSENVQKSGADEDSKLLAEAKAINKSLSALADVVEATAKRQQFVPYRNSKLTMLLEEALTSAKVLMMVHVSPLARDAKDTGHSLTFAGRVQAVDFGAQRMRAEQEERLKSGLQVLRKEKEAAEGREAELRKQNALLTEQLHSRQAASDRAATAGRAEEAGAPPPRRRQEQRGPAGRASPEPRHIFGRVPTPDPRQAAGSRGRPLQAPQAEHEASQPARQRQPTPRPSRQACEALMAQDAGSDSEAAEAAEDCGKAEARCEEGKGRVLCDITNLPGVGAVAEKDVKDAPPARGQLGARACGDAISQTPERSAAALAHQSVTGAEEDTVWVDQELQGAVGRDAADGEEAAAWPKSVLKKEKTNFVLKMKQRRLLLAEGVLNCAQTPTRRVHFDEEAVGAKSPPKWYMAILEYERQEARAREEEAGVSPAGCRPQRTERPSRRPREPRPTDAQELLGRAPPQWRR